MTITSWKCRKSHLTSTEGTSQGHGWRWLMNVTSCGSLLFFESLFLPSPILPNKHLGHFQGKSRSFQLVNQRRKAVTILETAGALTSCPKGPAMLLKGPGVGGWEGAARGLRELPHGPLFPQRHLDGAGCSAAGGGALPRGGGGVEGDSLGRTPGVSHAGPWCCRPALGKEVHGPPGQCK